MPPIALRAALPLAAVLAMAASPAAAQPFDPAAGPPRGAPAGDRVTIGFGLGAAPDYDGSNDYQLQPGGVFQAEISGISLQMRGLNLYTDLIPERGRTKLVLGPVAQLRLDRTGKIADPRVAALGKRDTAVELGLNAGISRRGVLIPPATLTFDVTVLHDVAGSHRSLIVSPALALASPVSQRAFARLSISADHVGKGFAQTYYDVAPAAAPGALARYATRGGGWKSVGTALLVTRDLGGDPRRGLAAFALGSYSRLLGQFAASPIVRDAGSASQGFAVTGLSYTF